MKRWNSYLVALAATTGVVIVRFLLNRITGPDPHFVAPLCVAVMVAAWHGGLRGGLFATVLNALAASALFMQSASTWGLGIGDIVRLVLFVIVGVLISLLCESLHRNRRRAEASAADARVQWEQLRLVTDSAPVMLVHFDRDQRYKFANRSLTERFGRQPMDVVGKSLLEVVGAETYERVRGFVEAALSGQRVEFEVEIPYQPLGVRWMHGVYEPVRGEGGEVQGFIATVMDVTERVRADAALKAHEDQLRELNATLEHSVEERTRALRQSEQWLAATLSSIGDGVVATDEAGLVRFMNPLAEQLTGWTETDALDQDVRSVLHIVEASTRETVPNPAVVALETGERTPLAPNTILIDRAGREHPIDDRAAPIRNASGKLSGAVLVFRDISERQRLEEDLRQAHKMEAIGRLAGGIAHDFNNVLTIISGYSELLLADDVSEAERYDSIRSISEAAKRAAALTQQIMAFSRTQMLAPTVLNLNHVVDDVGATVKRLIGSNIEFVTHTALDLGQVRADAAQIGRVILSLAANARDAMPAGGRLVISTGNTDLGEEVEVKAGPYAMLSVEDSGSGMAPEILARAFEPFFTTKGLGQATGLGLAAVYGIVKQSGGHVEVTSQVGEGTTFRVYLPRVVEPVANPKGAETLGIATGPQTILLVEDEEAVRRMTSKVLRRSGFSVLEAPDGLEAIAIVQTHPQQIDLLLTDLVMPHLSGREVADRLTAMQPGLHVLFMSGYTEDMVIKHGVESATAHFLHKPFSVDQLMSSVRRVLDKRGIELPPAGVAAPGRAEREPG